MRLSLAVGVVALLLCSAVDASSQYRSPNSFVSSSNRSNRRRTRSTIHRDDYSSDADYHRSSEEGGSGYSSLNDDWDIEESSSYSSFYDFEDLKRPKTTKKRQRKRDSIEETERILLALERSNKEEESERSKRKRRKRRKGSNAVSSSMTSKSPKRRRSKRRKAKQVVQNENPIVSPEIKKTDEPRQRPFAKPAFVSKVASPSNEATASIAANSSITRQTPQPHPDRTKWEVPSYSHKISTMMKKTESRPKPAVAATNQMENVASATTTAARRTKPTAATATPQSSTLGSSTTPWVRKFLAARPKGKNFNVKMMYGLLQYVS